MIIFKYIQERFFTGILLLVSCFFLASGCERDLPEGRPNLRTVFFYMGGDNNLSVETDQKIEQLRLGWKDFDGHLLIYQDTRNSLPRLLEICKGPDEKGMLKTIREYPESNSANAAVFGSVVQDVVNLYPSPSYGLVLFSHASGWLPEHTYENPATRSGFPNTRSVVIDSGAEMEIPAFAAAIPNRQFDFIIFEACFMAGIETAYELKDKTNYILGSSAEMLSPGFAGIYATALPLLFEKNADLQGFAKQAFDYFNQRQGDDRSATLSLVKTSELQSLAAFIAIHTDVAEDFEHALTTQGANVQEFSRYQAKLFFDFNDWYGKSLLPAQQAEWDRLLDATIVYKAATPSFILTYGGFPVSSHSGLTVYIPQPNYPNLNRSYQELSWYKRITDASI